MNENIDLTKILNNCPKGWKLYSSVYGELIYNHMYVSSSASKIYFTHPNKRSILDGTAITIEYSWDGRLSHGEGECTLFPSKDQRDWSKFTAPWYKKEKLVKPKFKVGDKIVDVFMKYMDTPGSQFIISEITEDKYIFTDSSYISISNQDSWELVPDKKPKFDPKTLQPYDKVLVRRGNENYNIWFPDFVADPPNNDNNKTLCMCVGDDIAMVIPYNDDTKHLIGTTDEAPEYYRYWED